jgi:hypothetical protein
MAEVEEKVRKNFKEAFDQSLGEAVIDEEQEIDPEEELDEEESKSKK